MKTSRFPLRMLLVALLAATGAPALARDSIEPTERTDVRGGDLEPGQYEWLDEPAAGSRVVVVVSLPEQMAHVYADGVRIGRSTISSGKPGHETPTGTFPILQKRREHYSNLYNNAPMPYMQRLTWDGIALHGGKIPGYPASHGCVRLPHAFAKRLFEITERDMMVVIADEGSHSLAVVHPGERVPVNPVTGLEPVDRADALAGTGSAVDFERTAAR
jgi:hypothetical protein